MPISGSGGQANIATSNPGASNDNTQGYVAGARWVNTTTGQFFTCLDASTGAAVWIPMDPADHPGYLSGNSYPLVRSVSAGGVFNDFSSGSAVAVAVGFDTPLYLLPFMAKRIVAPGYLGWRTATIAGANFTYKVGIWGNDPTNNRPTGFPGLYNDTAAAASAANFNVRQSLTGIVLIPGLIYWAGMKAQATAGGTYPGFLGVSTASADIASLIGFPFAAVSQPFGTSTAQISGIHTASAFATAMSGTSLSSAGTYYPVTGVSTPAFFFSS